MKVHSVSQIPSIPVQIQQAYKRNLRPAKTVGEVNKATWDDCVRVTISDAARQMNAQSIVKPDTNE